MASPKILLIGEPMVDTYYIGSTSRISPEAPIPVVKVHEVRHLQGGAANVGTTLAALGAEVQICYPPGLCPIKNRLMVDGVQLARWDEHDQCQELDTVWTEGHLQQTWDAIVISDYGKGAFTGKVKDFIAEKTLRSKTPVLVDTKSSPLLWSPRFTFFPNREEYARYESHYRETPFVVRTLGPEGMEYLEYGVRQHYARAAQQKPATVIGAGDCVIAGYAYWAAQGESPGTCLERASSIVGSALARPYTASYERSSHV